jgi:hypothetical protein
VTLYYKKIDRTDVNFDFCQIFMYPFSPIGIVMLPLPSTCACLDSQYKYMFIQFIVMTKVAIIIIGIFLIHEINFGQSLTLILNYTNNDKKRGDFIYC